MIRAQYDRYKKRLGDDAPKSFYAFKRLKNAGGYKWTELQEKYRNLAKDLTSESNRAILKEKIKGREITLVLNPEKQNAHILNTKEYEPSKNKSYFTISFDELQKIVYDNYASGSVKIKPNGQIKEIISLPNEVGFCVNSDGKIIDKTKRITIHYSKSRTHVVPTRGD